MLGDMGPERRTSAEMICEMRKGEVRQPLRSPSEARAREWMTYLSHERPDELPPEQILSITPSLDELVRFEALEQRLAHFVLVRRG